MFFGLWNRKSSASSRKAQREAELCELRRALTQALSDRRHDLALAAVSELALLEPREPRWAHKHGDALRAVGRPLEAAAAYRHAARLYEEQCLHRHASAMKRLARTLTGMSRNDAPPHPALMV
jgi:hypothetical protein